MGLRETPRALWLLLVAAAAAFAAETKQVADPDGAWRIAAPADWKEQRAGQMTMVSSQDGRANVVVLAARLEQGTVEEWFKAAAAFLQQQIPNWKLLGSQPLPVAGRQGLLARAESLSNNVAMIGDYVFVKGKTHQVMLSCNCAKADFAANQLVFGRIIASLELTEGAGAAAPAPAPRPAAAPPADLAKVQWDNYVSKHCVFTLRKPQGWTVQEVFQPDPAMYAFSVMHPEGLYVVSHVHGVSPAGRDAAANVRLVLGEMFKQAPTIQLAPAAKTRTVGQKTVYLFEGTYTDARNQRRQFRTMVTGGDGLLLKQQLDAADGQLDKAAPLLLQTLANLRVAKNVFAFDEGGAQAAGQGQPQPMPVPQLVPRQLAGGWGSYAAPANWQQADLGKGQVIASDPTQQVYFVVANAEFITPRYAHLVRMPGVLVANFCRPHQAMELACTKGGHGTAFRFEVTDRPDLAQGLRAGITGGRPCSVEHFFYTFNHKGKPYKGVSLGWCIGNFADASFSLGHLTGWAPAAQFDAWLPTLGQIMTSYQMNQQKVGEYVADGLRKYHEGIRKLSDTISRNSEQMRRENYELHMQRGRVQDYTSYLTTRMIMGEYDYLSSSFGYVRGDPSGLYTPEGNLITTEPYGESVTRHMQEINSRQLYEQVRPR
ncbi:MAG: hypothetical protein FJ291_01680 [Planctomycetes bacterium]|nr:hypothetical protein [Planctomycetota bacterium]